MALQDLFASGAGFMSHFRHIICRVYSQAITLKSNLMPRRIVWTRPINRNTLEEEELEEHFGFETYSNTVEPRYGNPNNKHAFV